MKLIVGLGNPGKEYSTDRHNIGFICLDNYLGDILWKKGKKYYLYIQKRANESVCFIKPQTYMNLSGEAVSDVVNFYKINPKDILIIHDDLDLPVGSYRIKYNSSSGGHNGIKSIISSLNTSSFCHLKIGIGKPNNIETKDYVLGKLSDEEINNIKGQLYKDIIDDFINYDVEYLMNKYN